MTVKSYTKSESSERPYMANGKRCKNFKVSEFTSPDGVYPTKIETHLVTMLEEIRAYFGGKVTITSGYRSPSYNEKIGGYKYSRHAQGKAADIVVYYPSGNKVEPKTVMLYLWRIGWREAGIMTTATHVGYRTDYDYFMEERGVTTSNGYPQISNPPNYFNMQYKVINNSLKVRSTYKSYYKTMSTKKKGDKVYFERVFKSGGKTWGKIKNGYFMLIKGLVKTYMKKY